MAMKLLTFRTMWGILRHPANGSHAHSSLEEAVSDTKRFGFDGIEIPLIHVLDVGKDKFFELLQKYELQWGCLLFTNAAHAELPPPGDSVAEHLATFKAQLEIPLSYKPMYINSHSGADWFSRAEAVEFFTQALLYQEQTGLNVMHETHRARILHSPWICRELVPLFPKLRMVADFSHFTCVAEAHPRDKHLTAVIHQLAPQIGHIHARVGFEEGPQVPDPRAPEWAEHVAGHEQWWDTVWQHQKQSGATVCTLTAEHGPFPYQHSLPHTQMPLADIVDVNNWVADRQRKRFAQLFDGT
eukprot:TRINITY_DN8672_c0_g1_i3.p2 TRINITY_DN8672_c0_g1~~TRINITY_DN8672_c0_g1_i3.p2  ORF type:complete len:299 (+),score=60.36 TRINITY_DN8672_c0_g1_i3:2607-3503(+)